MIIGGYRVGPLLKATGKGIWSDNLTALAAEAAYNFFFSIFPFFLLAGMLFGLLANGEQTADWILAHLARAVPPQASGLVNGVVHDVVFAKSTPGLISISAIFVAWSGSTIFRSLMGALNQVYKIDETRSWGKRALISLAALIGTGLLLFIASTITLVGPEIISWIGDRLHFEAASVFLWKVLQYPAAVAMLIGALFLIYRFLPNLHQNASQILVGATVAAFLWILITLLFRFYMTHFGSYNKTYGTIGAVMVMLTWMYLSMLAILVAGELNAELHRGTGALEPRKGAIYAGRLVTASDPPHPSNERMAPLVAGAPEQHGDSARR